MKEALTLERLNKRVSEKYEHGEKRIVGILLARYNLSLTQSIVDSCYFYWHDNTGKALDIFRAGYGAFLSPNEQSHTKIILKFQGNDIRIYYDQRAFITIKNELNQHFRISYQDSLQLILVNYRNGKLIFNESIKIDLEKNYDSIL